MTTTRPYAYTDLLPESFFATALHLDVRRGLGATQKSTRPVWFYDTDGSRIYEDITRTPEYYPTRTELQILTHFGPDIAARARADAVVELGAGSSAKASVLLAATRPGTYVPIDVSAAALHQNSREIAEAFPATKVHGVRADFNTGLHLPERTWPGERRLYAFFGSTLGNHRRPQRSEFLKMLRSSMAADDALLLGMDLVKGEDELVAAYNDAAGHTAAFNLNLLSVLNRELGADFVPANFEHQAVWSPTHQWIEMRLLSRRDQLVDLPALGMTASFAQGEAWVTEISAKVTTDGLAIELANADLRVEHMWTDPAKKFSLTLAVPR